MHYSLILSLLNNLPVCVEFICVIEQVEFGSELWWSDFHSFLVDQRHVSWL